MAPFYVDPALDADAEYVQPLSPGHTAFACMFQGAAMFGDAATSVAAISLAVFGPGDTVRMRGGKEGARLIPVAGKPFNERVTRHGPFVMSTSEEIVQAVEDFHAGRF